MEIDITEERGTVGEIELSESHVDETKLVVWDYFIIFMNPFYQLVIFLVFLQLTATKIKNKINS